MKNQENHQIWKFDDFQQNHAKSRFFHCSIEVLVLSDLQICPRDLVVLTKCKKRMRADFLYGTLIFRYARFKFEENHQIWNFDENQAKSCKINVFPLQYKGFGIR